MAGVSVHRRPRAGSGVQVLRRARSASDGQKARLGCIRPAPRGYGGGHAGSSARSPGADVGCAGSLAGRARRQPLGTDAVRREPGSSLPPDVDPVSRNRLPSPAPGVEGAAAIRRHVSSPNVRWASPLGRALTELAILTTAREHDQPYEWSLHEMEAVAVGLEPSTIDIVRHRRPLTGLAENAGGRHPDRPRDLRRRTSLAGRRTRARSRCSAERTSWTSST